MIKQQNWQEYSESMRKLRFSQQEKNRMVQNLLDPVEETSGKRHPIGGLAVALIMAVVLTTTVAAAGIIRWANPTRFVDSPEDAARQAEGGDVILRSYEGDWEYSFPHSEVSAWWEDYAAQGAEESVGSPQDGWTRKRILREGAGSKSMYLGESLTSFDGLWTCTPWCAAALESNYTPVDGTFCAETRYHGAKINKFDLLGAYQNGDGAAFTIEYRWNSDVRYDGIYQLSSGYDYNEYYQTADGVEVAVSMARSKSGEPLFWADYDCGHVSFSMVGTQLELEEIHTLLDGLALAGPIGEAD